MFAVLIVLAAYTIVVRSSEYDLPPEILDDIVARAISHFSDRPFKRVGEQGAEDDPRGDES